VKQDHLSRLPVVAQLLEFRANEVEGLVPGGLAVFPLAALSCPDERRGDPVGTVERSACCPGATTGPGVFVDRAGLQADDFAIFDVGVCRTILGAHLA